MGDKTRLCPACGTYISDGDGAKVRDQGGEWFVHNRPPCTTDAEILEVEDKERKPQWD